MCCFCNSSKRSRKLRKAISHMFAWTSLGVPICSLNNHSINAPLKRPLCLPNKASCKFFFSHMIALIAQPFNGMLSQPRSQWNITISALLHMTKEHLCSELLKHPIGCCGSPRGEKSHMRVLYFCFSGLK